ncbi:hypothetical protein BC940DRAFT_306189 [Gongronella butleri]|nr:hypothetical protein BC940DRAFT_306189 [Gongronella butleri]
MHHPRSMPYQFKSCHACGGTPCRCETNPDHMDSSVRSKKKHHEHHAHKKAAVPRRFGAQARQHRHHAHHSQQQQQQQQQQHAMSATQQSQDLVPTSGGGGGGGKHAQDNRSVYRITPTNELALFMRNKLRFFPPDLKPIPPAPGEWKDYVPDRTIPWEDSIDHFLDDSPFLYVRPLATPMVLPWKRQSRRHQQQQQLGQQPLEQLEPFEQHGQEKQSENPTELEPMPQHQQQHHHQQLQQVLDAPETTSSTCSSASSNDHTTDKSVSPDFLAKDASTPALTPLYTHAYIAPHACTTQNPLPPTPTSDRWQPVTRHPLEMRTSGGFTPEQHDEVVPWRRTLSTTLARRSQAPLAQQHTSWPDFMPLDTMTSMTSTPNTTDCQKSVCRTRSSSLGLPSDVHPQHRRASDHHVNASMWPPLSSPPPAPPPPFQNYVTAAPSWTTHPRNNANIPNLWSSTADLDDEDHTISILRVLSDDNDNDNGIGLLPKFNAHHHAPRTHMSPPSPPPPPPHRHSHRWDTTAHHPHHPHRLYYNLSDYVVLSDS